MSVFQRIRHHRREAARQRAADRVVLVGKVLRDLRADRATIDTVETLPVDRKIRDLIEQREQLLEYLRSTAQEG